MLTINMGSKMSIRRNNNQSIEDIDQEDKNQTVVGFIFDPTTYKTAVGFHREQATVTPLLTGHIRKGENRWDALAREAQEETKGSRLYLLNTNLDRPRSVDIFNHFKIGKVYFPNVKRIESFYSFLLEAEDPERLKPKGEEILRNRFGAYVYDWVGEEDLKSSNPCISYFFKRYYISEEMVSELSYALEHYKTFRRRVERKVGKGLYNPDLVKIDLERVPEELRNRSKYLEKILQR